MQKDSEGVKATDFSPMRMIEIERVLSGRISMLEAKLNELQQWVSNHVNN